MEEMVEGAGSMVMPVLGQDEKIISFKKQVIMLYEI